MVVVPTRVRPGQAARVHVNFRPGAARHCALEQRVDPAPGLGRRSRGVDDLLSTARGAAGRPARVG